MPDKPVQELVVAIAGPAVNVVICLLLFAVLATKFQMSDLTSIDQLEGSLTAKLMAVNFMLVAFNAIPAFPMDGGRVLRALLAMMMNYTLATTIAARTGQVLAVGFAVASFFGPTMLLFIAAFVFLAAQQELSMVKFRAGVSDRRVADVMSANFSAIPTGTPVAHALAIARGSRQGAFPVVDQQLRAIGIVSIHTLEEAMARGVSAEPVDDLARPVSRIPVNAPLGKVLGSLSPGIPVVVENMSGQIVGMFALQG